MIISIYFMHKINLSRVLGLIKKDDINLAWAYL